MEVPRNPSFVQMLSEVASGFERGENMAQAVRKQFPSLTEDQTLTLIDLVYDRQAGQYIDLALHNPSRIRDWGKQLADCIKPLLPPGGGSVLEVGVGEATTLAQVLAELGEDVVGSYGFDISHSRILQGNRWLAELKLESTLFVADIRNIPLESNSVDVVYSSHSLEPNRGLERALMSECLRVAKFGVVLVEPIYELANQTEQSHMDHHNYIRGLWQIAQELPAHVTAYKRLEIFDPPNPTGLLALSKFEAGVSASANQSGRWQCPATGAPLVDAGTHFMVPSAGLAYPVLAQVPLLAPRHAVVASSLVLGSESSF